ncbi:MAG: transposase [Proteobacteria bacterium]|nr:transposase [Pseudomonadota bacterium]
MDTHLCDGLSREDMLRVLGIDPSVVKWPDPVRAPDSGDELRSPAVEPLSDCEWDLIGPYLPSEPAQSTAMRNRAFIDAVLIALTRGSWTDHRDRGAHSDAVRRRFGRWAHQGVWQRLAAADLGIGPARKAAFATLARRAQILSR